MASRREQSSGVRRSHQQAKRQHYLTLYSTTWRAATYGLPLPSNPARGMLNPGVVESRWVPRSSKPVAGRYAGRGGFDTHPLPPFLLKAKTEYR